MRQEQSVYLCLTKLKERGKELPKLPLQIQRHKHHLMPNVYHCPRY